MLYIIVVNVVNVKIVVVEVIVSFTVDVVQVIVVFVVQIIVVYVAEVVRVIVVFDVVQVKVVVDVVHIIADDFLPVDVNFRFVIFNTYSYFKLNYDSRVVIWGIFQSGMTLES